VLQLPNLPLVVLKDVIINVQRLLSGKELPGSAGRTGARMQRVETGEMRDQKESIQRMK